jgi:hypothetical protein
MACCSWTDVVDDPAARHLVVARLVPKAVEEPAALLISLIAGLRPVGEFALLTRCEEAGPVTLCAFTHPDDAQALAAAVGAAAADGYAEWASRCAFTLDKTTAQGIADALEATPPPAAAPDLEPAYP